MPTWNVVRIYAPGALTIEALPVELTADGELYEYEVTDWREPVPPVAGDDGAPLFPERPGYPDGSIVIEGWSKWTADALVAALAVLLRDVV